MAKHADGNIIGLTLSLKRHGKRHTALNFREVPMPLAAYILVCKELAMHDVRSQRIDPYGRKSLVIVQNLTLV